jgi:hypothetical protein
VTTRAWTLLLLVLACAAVAALAAAWALRRSPPAADADGVATSQTVGQHCRRPPDPVLQALRRGEARLALVVKAFTPATPPDGRLVAWLVADDGRSRQEVGRFAIHPLAAFSEREPQRRQRFLLTVDEVAALPKNGQPLCVQAGFDPAAGGTGGRLVFAVEVIGMPAPADGRN